MTYTVVADKATNSTFLESDWDTYIKDNMNIGVWRPLGDTELAATTLSITLTGIPATLVHLAMICSLRADDAVVAVEVGLRFNGDTGNNYDEEQMYNNSGTTVAGNETLAASSARIGAAPAASAPASIFGGTFVLIPHYAGTSNNKAGISHEHHRYGTSTGNISTRFNGFAWRNNSAISSVTVFNRNGGNFVAGSRVTLFGMAN